MGYGVACIGTVAYVCHKRYLCQQLDSSLLGKPAVATLSEYEILFPRMRSGREPSHILNQPENGHVHLVAGEHGDAFSGIGKSHFLRRGYDHHSGYCKGLHESQMYVARSRRHIDEEIVKVAPPGISNQLTKSVGCHSATPKHRLVRIHHKSY